MNAFTNKPNIDGLVKELKREIKKRAGGLTRSKEINETAEPGKYVISPKPVKANAFTIKPDVSEFSKNLKVTESRKKSGTRRADSVTTTSGGSYLYPKSK